MSAYDIPGFASAERAYENMEPPGGGCDCLDQIVYLCGNCGEDWDGKGACCDEPEREQVTDEETLIEQFPVCSYHRSCGGCGDCSECGNIGDPDD